MRIRLVCLEDGIISCGFRKMAAWVERLNADTVPCYVSTNNYRSLLRALTGTTASSGTLPPDAVDEIARGLVDADLIGFSSMTGYADLTKAVIRRVRELSRRPYIVWGGIHPIIQPEDAILADVDAICTGEGEFAFEQLLDDVLEGRDHTGVKNFWFKQPDGSVIDPTNKSFDVLYSTTGRWRNGRLVEELLFYDSATWMGQVGLG